MTRKLLILSAASFALFVGCAQANDAAESAKQSAVETTQNVVKTAQASATKTSTEAVKGLIIQGVGANISDAPSGVYKSDLTHAYLTFQYLHQGYARPTIRWNDFEAVIDLDSENPTQSKLSVTIETDSIDSAVEAFDRHLVSDQFFDAENHPEITFVSETLVQDITGEGTLTGILTMKGVSKPVTLDVKLNKVGQHFQSKKPILGISATTQIKRSEWGLGKYTPLVGDEVDISIEAEFVKADE
ncbi:MAG: YceI family protein [Litorimonas sp.]